VIQGQGGGGKHVLAEWAEARALCRRAHGSKKESTGLLFGGIDRGWKKSAAMRLAHAGVEEFHNL